MRGIGAMIRDRLWLSLIGVVLVMLLAVAYIFNNVLGTPLLRGTETVTVEMTSTGGLYEGSAVTYRGVEVGKVRSIRLGGPGVLATIELTSSDRIPASSLAKVRSLSPVGEQYLDFEPASTDGPYLHDGSVIPASSTELPSTLGDTVISVNKLLDQIDTRQLHTLLTELSTGLQGTGSDLGTLIDQSHALLADLDSVWPETDRLISNTGKVAGIGPRHAGEIRALGRSARTFAQFLKNYDPTLRRQIAAAPGQIDQLKALLVDAEQVFPGFLGEALRFSDLFRAYAPHLGALLGTYAGGLGVLAKAIWGGKLRVLGIPQRSTQCTYGTSERDPRNPKRRPLVTTGHCPGSAPNLQRGAAHAPGPVR